MCKINDTRVLSYLHVFFKGTDLSVLNIYKAVLSCYLLHRFLFLLLPMWNLNTLFWESGSSEQDVGVAFAGAGGKNSRCPSALACLAVCPATLPCQSGSPLAVVAWVPVQALAEVNGWLQKLLGVQATAENKGECFGSHFQSSKDLK